ncbi:MAG: succinate dehydrogenase, cytochrome b556 subunit [Alphaproteobacteria bacterium]|nr:succinate dehydrogenase, cytochrome b556 subunit [Alphaproteobacteria bacterium]
MTDNLRPLSPHIFVYRWQITMVLSIVQRITGVGMFFGTALIGWWLVAAAIGDPALEIVYFVSGSWFGQLVLFFFVWALFQHMLQGIRHFFWDIGRGFAENGRFLVSWIIVCAGFVLTLLTFVPFVWM